MDESLIRLGLRSQTVIGGIQLILVAIFGITLIAFLKSTYNRETFTCVPETNSITKQLCYDEYSSAMNQWFTPLYFVVFAYVVLVVLSISFMLYGAFTLRQIKRDRQNENNQSKKPDNFKRAYLLHVCCRLILIVVLTGIFCGHQTLIVPKRYKCSVAAVTTPMHFNQTETDLHCHDQHYREKSIANIAIIVVKVFIMILCIIELIQLKRLTPPDKLLDKLLGEILDVENNTSLVGEKEYFQSYILYIDTLKWFSPDFRNVIVLALRRLERFSTEYSEIKNKFFIQSQITQTIQWTNQNSKSLLHETHMTLTQNAGNRMTGLILVLIGRKCRANF